MHCELKYAKKVEFKLLGQSPQPGLYMIGYRTGKNILKFLPFCRLNEENQEWENSKHQMKTKTKTFLFSFDFEFPALEVPHS